MTPPPAPPAQMITNEYQLASSKVPVNKLPANTLTANTLTAAAAEPASDEVFENPFAASDTASGAAEAKARQLRQQAALEQVWRAEQATARDTASAGSTAQVDAAMDD